MIKFFKKNGMLKLFSVLLAILLWLYVVQIENPQFEVSMHKVPVQLANEKLLEKNNLMVVEQSSETINFRLKGKRQSVIGLKTSDVSATIDVGNIQQTGTYSFSPQFSFPNDSISVLEKDPRFITLTIDEKEERTFGIAPTTTGTVKNGYYAERPVADQKEITVTGPVSLLDRITRISAVVDVDGAASRVKKKVKLKILDENGTELKSDKLQMNVSAVTMECNVYPTKKVKLTYDLTGNLEVEGYELKEVTVSTPTVLIAGEKDKLEQLEEIRLGMFDLSKVTVHNSKQVFSIVLPDGLISVDGMKNVAVEAVLKAE